MKLGNRTVRTWISLVIAVIITIAAMPGSMAMPSAKPVSHAAHAMMGGMHGDCCPTPAKAPMGHDDPCKSMAVCFGLLSCYGLAALPFVPVTMAQADASAPPVIHHQSVSGLSFPPDDPPPIAD